MERLQIELENNKILLAIRKAEMRTLEIGLEKDRTLLALKRIDLENDKKGAVKRESDEQEHGICPGRCAWISPCTSPECSEASSSLSSELSEVPRV